jgi:hypothetical protein
MKISFLALAVLPLSLALACSSNTNTSDGGTGGAPGTGGSGAAGTTGTGGAAGATGTGGAGAQGGAGGAPHLYTLTVTNYLDWCDVTENGTAYPAGVPPAMSFASGTVVNLSAVANSIFVWGYWTGTDGDTGAGHDMNMATTVTMTSDKTVAVCCPLPPSTTCP